MRQMGYILIKYLQQIGALLFIGSAKNAGIDGFQKYILELDEAEVALSVMMEKRKGIVNHFLVK